MTARPRRGEIRLTDFGLPTGHGAGYRRPTAVVPMTSRQRGLPSTDRLVEHLGEIDVLALGGVEEALRFVLEL